MLRLMPADRYEALREDIRKHRQLEPIKNLKARLRLLDDLRREDPAAIEINQYRVRRLPVAYELTRRVTAASRGCL